MRLALCFSHVFTGALVFALPNLSRREMLFAVHVPAGFRDTQEGRHAVALYRRLVAAAVLAGVCLELASPAAFLNLAALLAPVLLLVAGCVGFYRQHRRLRPFAVVQNPQPREVELTAAPDRLPWFTWLGIGPLLVILAAAALLYLNWDSIPARFPVHWGASGRPNRWATRTPKGVYGVLAFGAELAAWIWTMGLAGWYGARRSRARPVVLGIMISSEYLIGVLFAAIAVQPLLRIPIWAVVALPLVFLIPMVVVAVKKLSEPGDPLEPTPDECWNGGIFYYNPDDAALFVEKREGLGYTFNFANRWAWAILGSLALVLASGFFVLP